MKAPFRYCSIDMRAAAIIAALLLGGCAAAPPPAYIPPLGSNIVFDATPGAATDRQLIVADLRLAPDAVGAAHYHPWEEYLYVIEGEAVLEIAGAPARRLIAGERFIIPARTIHTPRAGPAGVRAIVTRVHMAGDPVSTPASAPAP